MVKITVVGSMSTDFVVTTKSRPEKGETVLGEDFQTTFGGKGANQAVAAVRLGATVAMVGNVGDDIYGQQIKQNLADNRVLVDFVESIPHVPSGSAHITLADDDNSIIVVQGANKKISFGQIDEAKSVILNSHIVMLQQEIPLEINEKVIALCAENQVKCILNPAPAAPLSKETVDKVSYFTPNELELKEIFPDLTLEESLVAYPNKLVVTLGSKGVAFHDGKEIQMIPAYQVKAVDTTGAGDTFNSAFAYGIAQAATIADSIKFANLAASLSIQKFGAQGGMPSMEEMRGSEYYEEAWHIK